MKLSGNHAMTHFVAAATLSSLEFASARIGRGLRQAPHKNGYDPTVPISRRDYPSQPQQHYYDRPASNLITDALAEALMVEDEYIIRQGAIQNNTANDTFNNISNSNSNNNNNTINNNIDEYFHLDIGVLTSATSPVQTPSIPTDTIETNSAQHSSSCMMAYDDEVLVHASDYLQSQINEEHPNGYGNIIFDAATNTVFCNQQYNIDNGVESYGCASMYFKGCNVKCNGNESCFKTTIEEADFVECEGYESCLHANLDATTVDCSGVSACRDAIIGEKQLVATLDCHSGESACAYAKTYSVGDVFCTGPLSCYGAELMGVESKVTCQGVPHPDGYYKATCGGENAIIEAADNKNIDVTCDGDFSCIGYGHDAYDHEEHPIYFDIDVGKHGSLTCEGSLIGNHDGETYVCQYIDIIQGCANYECQEPFGFDSNVNQRTCDHIFSVHHHEMCSEGLDDDDDDDDER